MVLIPRVFHSVSSDSDPEQWEYAASKPGLLAWRLAVKQGPQINFFSVKYMIASCGGFILLDSWTPTQPAGGGIWWKEKGFWLEIRIISLKGKWEEKKKQAKTMGKQRERKQLLPASHQQAMFGRILGSRAPICVAAVQKQASSNLNADFWNVDLFQLQPLPLIPYHWSHGQVLHSSLHLHHLIVVTSNIQLCVHTHHDCSLSLSPYTDTVFLFCGHLPKRP